MEDKSHILSLSQLMRNVAWATATSIINQRNTHHFALDKDAVGVIMMFDAYRGSSQTMSEKHATDNKKRNCFSTTSNFNFFSFGSGCSSFDASLHELLLLAFQSSSLVRQLGVAKREKCETSPHDDGHAFKKNGNFNDEFWCPNRSAACH